MAPEVVDGSVRGKCTRLQHLPRSLACSPVRGGDSHSAPCCLCCPLPSRLVIIYFRLLRAQTEEEPLTSRLVQPSM